MFEVLPFCVRLTGASAAVPSLLLQESSRSIGPAHDKISAGDLASTPRTVKQPFSGGGTQGSPATPIDPTRLIFTLWQFIVPIAADDGSATPMCTGSVTIDDIKFYH
jgi:hypothetical protein